MRDIMLPRGSGIRLTAALAGMALGMLTVAEPAAAEQSPTPVEPTHGSWPVVDRGVVEQIPRPVVSAHGPVAVPATGEEAPSPAAPAQAHGHAKAWPPPPAPHPGSWRPGSWRPGSWRPAPRRKGLTSVTKTLAEGSALEAAAAHPVEGSTAHRSRSVLVPPESSPDAALTLNLLLGAELHPHPGVKVCTDAMVGGLALGVHLALGAGGCLPRPPMAAVPMPPVPSTPVPVIVPPAPVVPSPVPPAPVVASPVPVAVQPAPAPALPAPAVAPAPQQPSAAASPAAPPSARARRAASPVPGRPHIAPIVPSTVRRYRPKVAQAAAHVLRPHRKPLENIMVVIILVLVVAVFTGGLFARL